MTKATDLSLVIQRDDAMGQRCSQSGCDQLVWCFWGGIACRRRARGGILGSSHNGLLTQVLWSEPGGSSYLPFGSPAVYYTFYMATIDDIQKRRGRPAVGVTPMLTFRSPPELTARIDAFAEHQQLARSEAIRRLVEKGLKAK
jgi:hypothetical protein